MAKRITLMIDDENYDLLIKRQAKGMVSLGKSYSFSRTANDVFRKGLREGKEKDD